MLAADLSDEAMAGLDIDYEYRTGDAVIDTQSGELRARRREPHQLDAEVTSTTERLATGLVAAGYSVRDAAVLTGVSY